MYIFNLESIKVEIERLGGRYEVKKMVESVDPAAEENKENSEENQKVNTTHNVSF